MVLEFRYVNFSNKTSTYFMDVTNVNLEDTAYFGHLWTLVMERREINDPDRNAAYIKH